MLNIPKIDEWHENEILKRFDDISWNDSIIELHKPENIGKYRSNFYERLAYDEILATFLVQSEIRKKIKKIKKEKKIFQQKHQNYILSKLNFELTKDQKKALEEINQDLKSNQKMFRLLQGDVGSGKTIVALSAAYNVIKSGFQVAIMAPTEILAKQHYVLAKKIFDEKIKIEILSSKTEYKDRTKTVKKLAKNEIDIIIGTHAIFQKKNFI